MLRSSPASSTVGPEGVGGFGAAAGAGCRVEQPGHLLGLLHHRLGGGAVELQRRGEAREIGLFVILEVSVGVADADRHFIGELAMLGRRECGGGVVERNLLEQDPLVERLQVGRAGFVAEGIGEAADLLTLSRVVGAVGKGSEQGDGEDGVLLFGSHLLSWSRYGIAGLSSSRARKRFMRIVRRPAEPVMNGRAFGRPRRIVAVRANPSLLPAGAGSILSAARGSETACALPSVNYA